mmetsp:Transcript_21320/g.47115  ORF Transcript_21320/g.47115 Transcript_21320/m.47115 type:complete len:227 (-) Transcript_21320:690-1370(-)
MPFSHVLHELQQAYHLQQPDVPRHGVIKEVRVSQHNLPASRHMLHCAELEDGRHMWKDSFHEAGPLRRNFPQQWPAGRGASEDVAKNVIPLLEHLEGTLPNHHGAALRDLAGLQSDPQVVLLAKERHKELSEGDVLDFLKEDQVPTQASEFSPKQRLPVSKVKRMLRAVRVHVALGRLRGGVRWRENVVADHADAGALALAEVCHPSLWPAVRDALHRRSPGAGPR